MGGYKMLYFWRSKSSTNHPTFYISVNDSFNGLIDSIKS